MGGGVPVVFEGDHFAAPAAVAFGEDGVAGVGGAVFEVGGGGDVGEGRTADAAGV